MIRLNSDIGERPHALADGSEEELIAVLDWANIACGGHAGDDDSMRTVLELCRKHGVQAGAHPSYPDREQFGREVLDIPPEAIAHAVYDQVRRLADIAARAGIEIGHVKPHGALYNEAARNPRVALGIAEGVARWRYDVPLVGLAGSLMLDVWRDEGFHTVGEAFADRRYEADGSLRSRRYPDALITDPAEAAAQAVRFRSAGNAIGTVCVHSDTPDSRAIARAVRDALAAL